MERRCTEKFVCGAAGRMLTRLPGQRCCGAGMFQPLSPPLHPPAALSHTGCCFVASSSGASFRTSPPASYPLTRGLGAHLCGGIFTLKRLFIREKHFPPRWHHHDAAATFRSHFWFYRRFNKRIETGSFSHLTKCYFPTTCYSK